MDFARRSASSPSKNTTTTTPTLNSCRVSFELCPDDYFGRSTCLSTFISKHPADKSWSNKFRLIKKSLISKKLKASRAYFRSLLFIKSASKAVSSSSSAKAPDYNLETDKSMKVEQRKTSFGNGNVGIWRHPTLARVIKKINKQRIEDKVMSNHRRSFSFSSAKTRRRTSPIKYLAQSSSSGASSSSFSSFSSISFRSSDFYEFNFHKGRCSFSTSDIEDPIEAAITHCKMSQVLPNSRKALNQAAGYFALPAPKIAANYVQLRM